MTLGTHSAALSRRGGVDPDVADQLGFTVYDVVTDLRRDVAAVDFPLAIEGADDAAASRGRLIAQLDEHLLPRLAELSGPALVVLAGSTGAGKSTIFNSLLRGDISDAGVLRPTTREPVVGIHPKDRPTLSAGPVTDLARIVEHEGVPRGTVLLDAPDLDSFVSQNRTTADRLLEGADLWLFVTTAARYGDALPWAALDRARERGASVAIVLNRVGNDTLVEIRGDLNARMRERGMNDTPLFVIPDVGPHEGLLDSRHVAGIGRWLAMMAGPERSRTVVLRTLKGALKALPGWVDGLVEAVDAQAAAARELRRVTEALLPEAESVARAAVLAGNSGSAQVTARFDELVSSRRIDRITVRDGVVRTSRHATRAREEALGSLRDVVEQAAARVLAAAGSRTGERIRAGLGGPGAPPGGGDILPSGVQRATERRQEAAEQAAAWVAAGDRFVATLGAGRVDGPGGENVHDVDAGEVAGEKSVEGGLKAFGKAGLATLLLAVALGNSDAARLTDKVLGGGSHELAGVLRTDLADRTALAVAEEARSVQSALEIPALADEAAATLRVRLAELRRLT